MNDTQTVNNEQNQYAFKVGIRFSRKYFTCVKLLYSVYIHYDIFTINLLSCMMYISYCYRLAFKGGGHMIGVGGS